MNYPLLNSAHFVHALTTSLIYEKTASILFFAPYILGAAIVKGLPDYEVIVPAYNTRETIEDAIESIQRQTHQPVRIIVVDDGSTDDTADLARKFPRVELIQQENSGSGAATNAGLLRVTAELVAFLDADDVWLPCKAENQIRYQMEKPTVAGTFTGARVFHGTSLDPQFVRDVELWTRTTLLMRGRVAKQIGMMETNMPGGVGEFVDWASRGRDLGFVFEMQPEIMAWRRIRQGSHTYAMDETKRRGYLLAARRALLRRRTGKPE